MANPKTCRHNVVTKNPAYIPEGFSSWLCVSCNTPVSSVVSVRKFYEFNPDFNVWVNNARKAMS